MVWFLGSLFFFAIATPPKLIPKINLHTILPINAAILKAEYLSKPADESVCSFLIRDIEFLYIFFR